MYSSFRILQTVGVCLLPFFWATPIHAQNTNQQEEWRPTAPFVAPVPEYASWRIKVQQLNEKSEVDPGAGSSRRVVAIDSVRTKHIKRDIITYANGKKSQVWYYKSFVIIIAPNGDVSFDSRSSEGLDLMLSEFSSEGYPFVNWINGGAFVELEKLQSGKEVAKYQSVANVGAASRRYGGEDLDKPSSFGPEDAEEKEKKGPELVTFEQKREAFIGKDSKLPVVITVGNTRLTFSFRAKPTKMLRLPASAIEQMRRISNQQRNLNHLRSISKAGR